MEAAIILDPRFTGIRYDEASKMASVYDVIGIIVECDIKNINKYFLPLDEELRKRCQMIRINGKGRLTPVADDETMKKIMVAVIGQVRIPGQKKEEWLRIIGVDAIVLKSYMEPEILRVLVAALVRYEPCEQYMILDYRIDLYLQKVNIAIECDENGHKNYNNDNELKRVVRITNVLGCKWVRFNPNMTDFNVGNVIAEVIDLIYT